ncbi:hypothetical protein RchiOBHm_Chr6g0275561 [Rosa chinensis]|uniref:Uncharacterized protein n=1 Tax=Rosa chinensis TaxID=74649 RepID=A0A2P6PS26_ROSCH|nr:hypothetical protein RchiOBHm_Chr6g0275561 [Rosa chinensis]
MISSTRALGRLLTFNIYKFGFTTAFAFNFSSINGLIISMGRADVEVGDVYKTSMVIYVAFSSQSPTLQLLDSSLFQNDLVTDIIAKTTLLDTAQIQKLKILFGGTN